jgi:hypothetical protein
MGPPAPEPPPQTGGGMGLARRLLLLLLCLAGGLGIGAAGYHLHGAAEWFLALPLCIAAGWLAVADPSACLTGLDHPCGQDQGRSTPRPKDGARDPADGG